MLSLEAERRKNASVAAHLKLRHEQGIRICIGATA